MKLVPVAALAATGFVAALSIAQDAPVGGSVEGTVVNSATGAGIAGASVTFFGGPSSRYQATSDAVGRFKITGIAPGRYRTNAEKDGFASPAIDIAAFLSNPGISIAASPDPVRVDLKLAPLSAIRGRVVDPEGKPAAGVEINLTPNILGGVTTDGEGRFAIEQIKPGSYTLSAKPPGSAAPVQAKDGYKTAMVATYYPSVVDQVLAERIVFSGQGDLSGYDIRMQAAPVHRVRGIVLDEDGKPSPGAEMSLSPRVQNASGVMGLGTRADGIRFFAAGLRPPRIHTAEATAIAGKDGRFEFAAVRSGDWNIDAESDSPSQGGASLRGSGEAIVGRDDIDDVEVHIARPFNLRGTLEWKSGDPVSQRASNPRVRFSPVTLVATDGDSVHMGIVEAGEVLFENVLPGRYTAVVQPGLAARIFLGDYEVTDQSFMVAAAGPRLRVALGTRSGTVRGTVEKGEGATVVLLPQQPGGVAIGQTIRCGAGGSFQSSEVSPGDYYIAAFDRMDGLFPSAEMVGLMPSRGASVRVEEGSAATATLTVISLSR
ncbi:MAG TPA: carboxypeptidase-like regulatory domain-containing protein [Bryobacteraceae bacterium]|jgi:hypothetical protein